MKRRISQKIAAMLTFFIFTSVLIFSFLTTALLKTSLLSQKSAELLSAAQLINEVIEKNAYESQETAFMLREAGIPFYILYTIYTLPQNPRQLDFKILPAEIIFATNDPFIPILPPVKKPQRYIEKNFFADGDLNILYTTTQSENLFIQTALYMDTDSIDALARNLPFILALISLPLLVLSFFGALFFTARMLRPVQLINCTAKEISAHNLNSRIPENGSGDELEELARTFNSLFERLQTDFERERRFVSDISHELKTPLAVMLGHLNLLRRWGKNDAAVMEKSLETSLAEAKSMQTLIENMLQLSQSENSPPAKKTPLFLHPLLERVAEDIELIHPKTKCLLQCPVDAQITANAEILTQVLRILTDNAIRYSDENPHIEFEFVQNKQQDKPRLIVRDRGIGIQAKDLPHIFDRLYRADKSRNRQSGGSGLGLAIAKSLLARIDAAITAESPAPQTDGSRQGTQMIIEFKTKKLAAIHISPKS